MSDLATELDDDAFSDDGAYPVDNDDSPAEEPAATYEEVTERVLDRHAQAEADAEDEVDPWTEGFLAALDDEEFDDEFDDEFAEAGLSQESEAFLANLTDEQRQELDSHVTAQFEQAAIASVIESLPEDERPSAIAQVQAWQEQRQANEQASYAVDQIAQQAERTNTEAWAKSTAEDAVSSAVAAVAPDLDAELVENLAVQFPGAREDPYGATLRAAQLLDTPQARNARALLDEAAQIDAKAKPTYDDVTRKYELREAVDRQMESLAETLGHTEPEPAPRYVPNTYAEGTDRLVAQLERDARGRFRARS